MRGMAEDWGSSRKFLHRKIFAISGIQIDMCRPPAIQEESQYSFVRFNLTTMLILRIFNHW